MGRRKIQIAPITDDRNRNVTFGKRRNGLFKKAFELGVLCSVDVAVLVWGHNGKLFAFSSQGNLKGVVDRYNVQSQDEMDVIGPRHYGGEVSPSAGMHPGSDLNGVKGSKGGNKRRRRSDDDSDEDDDDDGDEDGDFPLGGSMGQAPIPQNNASSLPNEMSMYQNGSPNLIDAQRFQQQQQHQQQAQQGHPSLASHPFFGNYPYPGYPHHMPNVNPALGNPLGFYAPSAAAMAAAAAATGQYNYGGLPPHLLRAAAQQYAQENGSSTSTPSSGNVQNTGYTPIVNSPTSMDMNQPQQQQQQQQQQAESSNSYASRQNTANSHPVPGSSPRSARKPALHLNFSNSNNGPPRSQSHAGPSRTSSMNENDGNVQQQYSQHNLGGNSLNPQQQHQSLDEAAAAQEAAAVSAYAEQAGLTIPPHIGGMQFPDSFLTSPSQLFPEIYRSMNSFAESQAHRAMTFGAENTPGMDDEDDINGGGGNDQNGRNVFRWPTLGNLNSSISASGQNNNNTTNNNNNSNSNSNSNSNGTPQGQERNEVSHPSNRNNHINDASSHLRVNGQSSDSAMVKREMDNETEIAV